MFIQYYVDRAENALLAEVDHRAEAELVGRFEYTPAGTDGQAVALRRLGEQLAHSSQQLVERQVELWRASIEAANERWTRMADNAGKHLQSVLTASLAESLKTHARELSVAEQVAAEKNRQHWNDVQKALVQAAETIRSVHDVLAAKADVLGRAVEATGQVARLEETLNRNLSALAGAKNFEQTVISLASAIHLLSARLAPVSTDAPTVQLEPRKRTGQAA
jgi:hypothetical protein